MSIVVPRAGGLLAVAVRAGPEPTVHAEQGGPAQQEQQRQAHMLLTVQAG